MNYLNIRKVNLIDYRIEENGYCLPSDAQIIHCSRTDAAGEQSYWTVLYMSKMQDADEEDEKKGY